MDRCKCCIGFARYAHTGVLIIQSKGLWRGVGEPPLRGLYDALASSSIGHQSLIISFVKKPPPDPREYLVQPFSTSDLPNEAVFFTRSFFRAGPATFKQFAERAAKRESCPAPHASNGEQARRIRPSIRLPAPMDCPAGAASAPFYVNSMNERLGRQDEERWY